MLPIAEIVQVILPEGEERLNADVPSQSHAIFVQYEFVEHLSPIEEREMLRSQE